MSISQVLEAFGTTPAMINIAMRGHSEQEKDAVTTTFEYDDFGQLIECVTEGVGSTSYEYDLNGNVISKDDGSVVTEYEWNDKNGLIGVAVDDSTVWQSTYYPDGKRYSKTNTDGTVYYVYDSGKPIGTYNTDWSRRESFGYGLGSRDPVVNTQYSDGQDAYYYVKDGLGNVNMILNADEATEATMAVAGCEVPAVTGSYQSDVNFGAGSWKLDPDLNAYIGNWTNPESGKTEGWMRHWNAECGHCITEIGLEAWDFNEDDDDGEGEVPWPPFTSPLPGNPVVLDAGDAGFGIHGRDLLTGILDSNLDRRHTNGIDWAAKAYEDHPRAIADFKKTIRYEGRDMDFSSYDRAQDNQEDGTVNWGKSIDYEMTRRYSLPLSKIPANPPYWRVNGSGTGIRFAGYRHQLPLSGRGALPDPASPTIRQGKEVSTTNRYANDNSTNPHLHLHLWDEEYVNVPSGPGIDSGVVRMFWGKGADAAWQEKYFHALPEIPLHIYLTAICRYGWIQSSFDPYSNDWSLTWGAPPSLHCMHTGGWSAEDSSGQVISSGTYTYGDCASRCQGAVAHYWLSEKYRQGWTAEEKESECGRAHFDEKFYFQGSPGPSSDAEHTGCAACCDHRFSEFLMGYAGGWASEYELPIDNLANARNEGYLQTEQVFPNGAVLPFHYNVPGYVGSLATMGEQMLTAWQMATDKVEKHHHGTCADTGHASTLKKGHDQGAGWCN